MRCSIPGAEGSSAISLAGLLRSRRADRSLHVLALLGRRQHGFHPKGLDPELPAPSLRGYCSWNELLAVREQLLGRKVARHYLGAAEWKAAYERQPPGPIKEIMTIGVLCNEGPEGMSLWANWNGTFLPEFKGTPLEELFPNTIEPFVAATRAALIASGDLPST